MLPEEGALQLLQLLIKPLPYDLLDEQADIYIYIYLGVRIEIVGVC